MNVTRRTGARFELSGTSRTSPESRGGRPARSSTESWSLQHGGGLGPSVRGGEGRPVPAGPAAVEKPSPPEETVSPGGQEAPPPEAAAPPKEGIPEAPTRRRAEAAARRPLLPRRQPRRSAEPKAPVPSAPVQASDHAREGGRMKRPRGRTSWPRTLLLHDELKL